MAESQSTGPAAKAQPGTVKWWAEMLHRPETMASLRGMETKYLSAERVVQIFLTDLLMRKPEILGATVQSVLSALSACVAMGLEPGTMVHFTTFNVKDPQDQNRKMLVVQYIPDYKGLIRIAYRSPIVKDINAQCVFEDEEFSVVYGDQPSIRHVPSMEIERTIEKMIGCYAIVRLVNGGFVPHIMSREQVNRIRYLSKSPEKGPWVDHPLEQARKTVLRNVLKHVPVEEYDVSRAIAAADAGEFEWEREPAPAEQAKAAPAALPQSKVNQFAQTLASMGAKNADAQQAAEAMQRPAPAAAASKPAQQATPTPKPVPRVVEITEEDIPF